MDDIEFDPDKRKFDPNAPLGGGLGSVFLNKELMKYLGSLPYIDSEAMRIRQEVETLPTRLDVIETRMINLTVQTSKIITLLTAISETLKQVAKREKQ